MQNNFEAPVWLLKMVFDCSIAWCDLVLGRKPKLSCILRNMMKMQNWSKRPLWSDPESFFFNPETNFLFRWHGYGCGPPLAQPKQSKFLEQYPVKSLFCSWNSFFLPALFWVAFLQFFKLGFLFFFIMGLSRCTAYVGEKYIGEVISPFRTLPMEDFHNKKWKHHFFRVYPPKKPILFNKKSR